MPTNPLAALRQYQDGHCAVCKQKRKLVVDHDHATGLVRGLLCYRCNTSEGGGIAYPWMVEYRANPPMTVLGLLLQYDQRNPPKAQARRPGGPQPMIERWFVDIATNGRPPCPTDTDQTTWDEFCRWAEVFGNAIKAWEQEDAEAAEGDPIDRTPFGRPT